MYHWHHPLSCRRLSCRSVSLFSFTLASAPDFFLAHLRLRVTGQRNEAMAQLCTSEEFDAVSGDRSKLSELVMSIAVNKSTKTASIPREENQLKTFHGEVVGIQDAFDLCFPVLRCRQEETCPGVVI